MTMKTYFKNKEDWFSFETVLNTDPYPNEDKMTKEQVDDLYKKLNKKKGEPTPKSVKQNADQATKILLDTKIKSVIDLSAISLIDITAHVDDKEVTGIINYRAGEQHLQKRF